MFSLFQKYTPQRSYLPDSIYSLCGEDTQNCEVCSNVIWSPVVNGYVHDTQLGKVFCPFGKGDTLNISTYNDQAFINKINDRPQTTWGNVPQLNPRPLARIGLEFRT